MTLSVRPARLEPHYSKKCDDWTYSDAACYDAHDTHGCVKAPSRLKFARRVGALLFLPKRHHYISNKVDKKTTRQEASEFSALVHPSDSLYHNSHEAKNGNLCGGIEDYNLTNRRRRDQRVIRNQLLFHLEYVERLARQLENAPFNREIGERLRRAGDGLDAIHKNSRLHSSWDQQRRLSELGLRKIYSLGDLKSGAGQQTASNSAGALDGAPILTTERVIAAATATTTKTAGNNSTPKISATSDMFAVTRGINEAAARRHTTNNPSSAMQIGTTCSDGAVKTHAMRRAGVAPKSYSDANIKLQAEVAAVTASPDWLQRGRRPSRRRPSHPSMARLAEALKRPVAMCAFAHPILKSDNSQYATALISDDELFDNYDGADSLTAYENAPSPSTRRRLTPTSPRRVPGTGVSLRMIKAFREAAATSGTASTLATPQQTHVIFHDRLNPISSGTDHTATAAAAASSSSFSMSADRKEIADGNYAVPADCFSNSAELTSSVTTSPSLSPPPTRHRHISTTPADHHSAEAFKIARKSSESDRNETSSSKTVHVTPTHFMNVATADDADGSGCNSKATPPPGLVKPVTPPLAIMMMTAAAATASGGNHRRHFDRVLCETLRKNISGSFTKYDGDRATHEYPHIISSENDDDVEDEESGLRDASRRSSSHQNAAPLSEEDDDSERVDKRFISERLPLVQHTLHHRHLEPISPVSDERHRHHFHNDDQSPRRNQLRQRHYQHQHGGSLNTASSGAMRLARLSKRVDATAQRDDNNVTRRIEEITTADKSDTTEKHNGTTILALKRQDAVDQVLTLSSDVSTQNCQIEAPLRASEEIMSRRVEPSATMSFTENLYDNTHYQMELGANDNCRAALPHSRESPPVAVVADTNYSDNSYDYVDDVMAAANMNTADAVIDQSSANEAIPCSLSDSRFPSSISTLAASIAAAGMAPIVSTQRTRADSTSTTTTATNASTRATFAVAPCGVDATYSNLTCDNQALAGAVSPTTALSSRSALESTDETASRVASPNPPMFLNSSTSLPVASVLATVGSSDVHVYRPSYSLALASNANEEDDYDLYEELSNDDDDDVYGEMMSLSSSLISVRSELNPRIVFQRGGRSRASGHSIKSQHRKQQQQRRQRIQQQRKQDGLNQPQQEHRVEHQQEIERQQIKSSTIEQTSEYGNKSVPQIHCVGKIARDTIHRSDGDLEQAASPTRNKSTHSDSKLERDVVDEPAGIEHAQNMYRTQNLYEMNDKNKMEKKSDENRNPATTLPLTLCCEPTIVDVHGDVNVVPPLPPKPRQFSPHHQRDERLRRVASSEKFQEIDPAITKANSRKFTVGGPSLFVDIFDDYADIVVDEAPRKPLLEHSQLSPIKDAPTAIGSMLLQKPADDEIDYVSICPLSTMALGKLSRNRKRFSALVKKSNSMSGLNQAHSKPNRQQLANAEQRGDNVTKEESRLARCRRQNSTSAAVASPGAESGTSGEYFLLDSASLSSRDSSPTPVFSDASSFLHTLATRAAEVGQPQHTIPHSFSTPPPPPPPLPPLLLPSANWATTAAASGDPRLFAKCSRPLNKKKASSSLLLFRH